MSSPSQLSFLPDDYLERKVQRRTNAICGVLFVLVMGGVGSAFWLSEQATARLDADYARVEQQYVSEAKRLEQVRELHAKQKRMAQQAELSASLLERVPRSYLLAEITNLMPAGVSLLDFLLEAKTRVRTVVDTAPKTAYEMKKAARQGNATGKDVNVLTVAEPKLYDVYMKMTGIAFNDVQVAQFLNKLSRSKLLRDVNLVITDQFNQGEDRLRKFQIEMMLSPDAEVTVPDTQESKTTAVELKE